MFISVIVIILLVIRKKIICIIAGFIYLILGSLFWLYKSMYYCYILFTGLIEFNDSEDLFIYAIIILIVNILLIILRLIICYKIKVIFGILKLIEKYFFERDHTEFLKKIAEDIDVSILKEDVPEQKFEDNKVINNN